jgi:hypothetical protein
MCTGQFILRVGSSAVQQMFCYHLVDSYIVSIYTTYSLLLTIIVVKSLSKFE